METKQTQPTQHGALGSAPEPFLSEDAFDKTLAAQLAMFLDKYHEWFYGEREREIAKATQP